jgi:hypothetical protein
MNVYKPPIKNGRHSKPTNEKSATWGKAEAKMNAIPIAAEKR